MTGDIGGGGIEGGIPGGIAPGGGTGGNVGMPAATALVNDVMTAGTDGGGGASAKSW